MPKVSRRTLAAGAAVTVALAAGAIVLRLTQRHHGLIYPDDYDYLLMARGISEHLRPTTMLGPGGELFVPGIDAATKPLFPAIVAALHELGLGIRTAAGQVAAVSAGLAGIAGGLLVLSLRRSWPAALACALTITFSPDVAYWWGYAGPDALAVALALLAATLLARRHGLSAGVVAGLAGAARPELLILTLAAALAALLSRATRPLAIRVAVGCLVGAGIVFGVVRPPLTVDHEVALALLAIPAGAVALALAWWAGRRPATALGALVLVVLAIAAAAIAGRIPGMVMVGRNEWPLLAAALLSAVVLCLNGRGSIALAMVLAGVLIGAMYDYKNPSSGRYASELIPLVAVLAALAIGSVRPVRSTAFLASAATIVLLALNPAIATEPPAPGVDAFTEAAPAIAKLSPGTLVTAAPDAYGWLLPDRPQRTLHAGARGLIVLDAAQRYIDPRLGARGKLVLRFYPYFGLLRPDGSLDAGPTVVVRGIAVERDRHPRRAHR